MKTANLLVLCGFGALACGAPDQSAAEGENIGSVSQAITIWRADTMVQSITRLSQGGAPSTYQVTVKNNGDDSARDVRFSFALPPSFSFVGTPRVLGGAGTCTKTLNDTLWAATCTLSSPMNQGTTQTGEFVVTNSVAIDVSAQVYNTSPERNGLGQSLMANNFLQVHL